MKVATSREEKQVVRVLLFSVINLVQQFDSLNYDHV